MFRKIAAGTLIAFISLGAVWATPGSVTAATPQAGSGFGNRAGAPAVSTAGSALATTPLSAEEAAALVRAIREEYNARALYQSVLNSFGNVLPFSRIVRSEAQHYSALAQLAQRYGVQIPALSAPAMPTFATLSEACQAGINAEIADAALYDELSAVTTHADILRVYANLKSASLTSHVPAFEVCR